MDIGSRTEITQWLKKYFCNYYNLNEIESINEAAPLFRFDLHVSNQKFFMFKKNVIWEANCHEYLYLFSVDRLDSDLYTKIEDYVLSEGMKLIKPGKDHMYTYLTLFIVADSCDEDAIKLLKKCKIRKDFKFSFHGWMELHTALCSCDSKDITTNKTGREYKKLLKNIKKYSK